LNSGQSQIRFRAGSEAVPTRADEESDKQKMRRDEKKEDRAIEKGGRASNPENHHFLG